MRTLVRRCNYDTASMSDSWNILSLELLRRDVEGDTHKDHVDFDIGKYVDRYFKTKIADTKFLDQLDQTNVQCLTSTHIRKLLNIIRMVLSHPSFDIVCVHDEFKCGANHVNQMRFHYKEIMAEIAESNILDDILSSIHGSPKRLQKLSNDLPDLIRNSNYAIC